MSLLNLPHDFSWTILLCLVSGYLFYKYFLANKKCYLEEFNIPFFTPPPTTALLLTLVTNVNSHEQEMKKYKTCGKLYGTTEAGRPLLSIANPELIKKILVKDFNVFNSRRTFNTGDPIADNIMSVIKGGEQWKRIRTIVSPTFSTGKIKKMSNIILDSSKTLVQNFISNAGKTISGKEFYNAFTMDVIASAAFGTKLNSFEDPNNRFLQEAKPVFGGKISWQMLLHVVFPKVATFFKVSGFLPPRSMNFFKEVVLEIIEHRRKTGQVKNDFLQLLLDAGKENETSQNDNKKLDITTDDKCADELGHDENDETIFKSTKVYKALTEDELLAQCVIFLLGGYETTASALALASYLLAANPEVQEKLKTEVDTVICKHGGKLTYDAIQEMKYLDGVISESLRMYSPIVRLERVADEDYLLEGTGITIKKNTIVSIPIYCMQNDPEYFPEPEQFRPERFTTEEKITRHPYTFLTFGAGPRNCIATRFAMMEMKLCLAHVMSHVKITTCPETKVPLIIRSPRGMLSPNVKFRTEKRPDSILHD